MLTALNIPLTNSVVVLYVNSS